MTNHPAPDITAAKVDRWLNHPDSELSVSAQVARKLAAGEVISATQEARRYGVSGSLVALVVHDMRIAGYRFETSHAGRSNRGTIQLSGQERSVSPVVRPPQAAQKPAQPYPALGQQLKVRALALTDTDEVVIMLSDGNGGAWQAKVTGST